MTDQIGPNGEVKRGDNSLLWWGVLAVVFTGVAVLFWLVRARLVCRSQLDRSCLPVARARTPSRTGATQATPGSANRGGAASGDRGRGASGRSSSGVTPM